MITSARITNIDGTFLDMNEDFFPFNEITTEIDTRFTERNKPQRHGLFPGEQWLGKRVWHIEGAILADTSGTLIDRRRKLVKVLTPRPHLGKRKVGTLQISWVGIAEPLSCDFSLEGWPEIPARGLYPALSEFQVNLKCYDPRLYGVEQTTAMVAPPLSVIGRSYDKTYSVNYPGGSGQPSDVVITNAGDIETYPRFHITGYAESPRVTLHRYDGEMLQVALEGLIVDANSYVDLDLGYRTATMNGSINVYKYTTLSKWWALEPTVNGVGNVVTYSAANILPGSAATIYWRNAYML